MKLQRCAMGHYYNGDKFLQCPHCAGNQKARTLYDDSQRKIVTVQKRRKKNPIANSERTAGWLVCLTEPRCGQSFPLLEGTNWIGVGREIHIALTTELEPDGALLARIVCDSVTGSATLVYPSEEEAASAETEVLLEHQQQIQIGDVQFVYVRFENKNYWK